MAFDKYLVTLTRPGFPSETYFVLSEREYVPELLKALLLPRPKECSLELKNADGLQADKLKLILADTQGRTVHRLEEIIPQ